MQDIIDLIHIMISQEWPVQGQYIDVTNHQNKWVQGYITDRTPHSLQIRLIRQFNHPNLIISIPIPHPEPPVHTLAPFRTHTRSTSERISVEFSEQWRGLQGIQERMRRLQQFGAGLKGKTPKELVQTLRGDHLFYLFSLLEQKFSRQEDLAKVYQYHRKHLQLISRYIEVMLEVGLEQCLCCQEEMASEDEEEWRKAYVSCAEDIFRALYNISSHCQYVALEQNGNYRLISMSYMNHSSNSRFLCEQLLVGPNEAIKRLVFQCGETRNRIKGFAFPSRFIFSLLFALNGIAVKLTKEKDQAIPSLLHTITDIVCDFFEKIFSSELNDTRQQDINSILDIIRVLMSKFHLFSINFKEISTAIFRYYAKQIQSPKEEVQLKGVANITKLVNDLNGNGFNRGIIGMKKENFIGFIKEGEWVDVLLSKGRSEQFQYQALECLKKLLRDEMIDFETMIAYWRRQTERQPEAIEYLKKQWLITAKYITPRYSQDFIAIAEKHAFPAKGDINHNKQLFEYVFVSGLSENLHNVDHPKEDEHLPAFKKRVEAMIHKNLTQLLEQNEVNSEILDLFVTTIENWNSKSSIEWLFKMLPIPTHAERALYLIKQFYGEYQGYLSFVPENFAQSFLNAMKAYPFSPKGVQAILSLFFRFVRGQKRGYFTDGQFDFKEALKGYWEHIQTLGKEYRDLLYKQMTNIEDMEDQYDFEEYQPSINPVFSNEMKQYINSHLLNEDNFASFPELNKKELLLIIDFFISANIIEKRLETKKDDEQVLLVRNAELVKQERLWSVFRKCKSSNLIETHLNPYLIRFYFYFSTDFPKNLRKGRIQDFFSKVKQSLQDAHGSDSKGLIRRCLRLLKDLIQIVDDRQQKKRFCSYDVQTRISIQFNNKILHPRVNTGETLSNVKVRLAKKYKLDHDRLIMFDPDGNEIGFDTKEAFLGRWEEASEFKVIQAAPNEETMSQFFYRCMAASLQEILLVILLKDTFVEEVQGILKYLDMGQQCFAILTPFITSYKQDIIKDTKAIKFFTMTIKLLNEQIYDQPFMEKYLSSSSFDSLLKILNFPLPPVDPTLDDTLVQVINTCSHINQLALVIQFCELMTIILKKGIKIDKKAHFIEKCMESLITTLQYQEKNKLDKILRENCNKICQSLLGIIEEAITFSGMFVYIFSHPHANQFLSIFFGNQYNELKIALMERFKKYIASYRLQAVPCIAAESKAAEIFIEDYFCGLLNLYETQEFKKVFKGINELTTIISKIASTVSFQLLNEFGRGSHQSFFNRVMDFLTSFIDSQPQQSRQSGILLFCLHLQLLRTVLSKMPQAKTKEIIDFAMIRCFGIFKNSSEMICSRKNMITKHIFEVIAEVLHSPWDTELHGSVLRKLIDLHNIPFWRESNKWSVPMQAQGRGQYMGLSNPGCICYMNSLLQQLFMIQQFRNEITKLNPHCDQEKDNATPILRALKDLFLKMELSDERVASPVEFSRTIRNSQNKAMIRINQQMDIDEFQSILFDKVEKELQALGSKNVIRQLFGGVYANQIVSTQCSHRSEREETFISISLEVKKNIHESLKSFVKVDMLDGDNKYFCENCNKKVTAQKIQCLKKLPPFLFLCLKRFQFNFDLEAKIKINQYCEFPHKIDLKEFLARREKMEGEEEKQQENFEYKLRGVVIHTGSADCGHYYSYIQAKPGQWFQFNDEQVYNFDINKLPEQAFGGKGSFDDPRIRNAYMLIYQRQNRTKAMQAQKQPEDTEEVNKILKKNQDIQKYDLLFSEAYEEFLERMLKNFMEAPWYRDSDSFHSQFYEFYLSYYFLILLRKEGFQKFYEFGLFLQRFLKNSSKMRENFLSLFASCSFLEEVFVYNPSRERCRVSAYLLFTALSVHTDQTFDIDPKSNIRLVLVLSALKITLLNHGPILEITLALNKFVRHLLLFHPDHLSFLMELFSFEIAYIELMFGTQSDKEDKMELMATNKANTKIPFFTPVQIIDKKHLSNESYYNWALLAVLVEQLKSLASESEESNAFKNFSYLASTIGGVSASRMASIIYDSHNERGASDLYKVYKLFDLSRRLLEGIDKGLKDYESSKYRPFMLLLLAFLRDPEGEEYYEDIISILENAYRHNERYVMETDLLNQWIIRLATQNASILRRFRERRRAIVQIIKRLKKSPSPGIDTLKKQKLANGEKILNRYYGIVVSMDSLEYERNSMMIRMNYQAILQGTIQAKGKPQAQEEPYTEGMQVQYYEPSEQKWVSATVISCHLGRVALKTKHPRQLCCWEDAERLRRECDAEEQEMEREDNSDYSYQQSQQDRF